MRLSIGKCWGLLIFDLFGLAIAGYGYLLGYQIIQTLPHADAFIILMGLFIGIKLVILSLYDLNRSPFLKNIPFFGGLVVTVGNGIIFGLCLFLIPEVPFYFFMGLALVDFLMITVSHLLWWLLIGKDGVTEKAQQLEIPEKPVKRKKTANRNNTDTRKNWLSSTDDEEADYDSIFNSLIENSARNNTRSETRREEVMRPAAQNPMHTNYIEAEKRYETGEFLKDIKRNLGKEKEQSLFAEKESSLNQPNRLDFEESDLFKKQTAILPKERIQDQLEKSSAKEIFEQKSPKEIVDSIWEMPKEKEKTAERPAIRPAMTAEIPKMSVDREMTSPVFEPSFKTKEIPKEVAQIKAGIDFNTDDQGDFSSIEKRLSNLFTEIEQSMEETHYLQNAVGVFQKEIESYQPIAGDEKIIAAGNLIREKLKAIIDKQFVVDEVLDDLISLSKVINKRIDDLDMIEAGLNQRKNRLDQKEILMVETKGRRAPEKIEIRPEELIMENQDSEYIVAEEDYETIQRYLKRVK
ncbi:hypothetical protein Q5O24_14475 [Eubacteriaceae bacterium ES3]|nr:hypothetical protein Q5O24_14475 [Eubacteriaceae bacterium ES3]